MWYDTFGVIITLFHLPTSPFWRAKNAELPYTARHIGSAFVNPTDFRRGGLKLDAKPSQMQP